MQKRRIVLGVFMAVILGLVVWAGISMASIESKNFYDYFGIAYTPNASEQPQARFAVLQKLLQLRSQHKEAAKREIELVKTIETVRDLIAGGEPDIAKQKQLVEMLEEQAGLPEQRKKLYALYFSACRLARNKNFDESADLAGCNFLSSVNIEKLSNQVVALQMIK